MGGADLISLQVCHRGCGRGREESSAGVGALQGVWEGLTSWLCRYVGGVVILIALRVCGKLCRVFGMGGASLQGRKGV